MKFEQLNLNSILLGNLKGFGYTELTEIQEAAIPFLLEGGNVLGVAQTGTGKTAAFLVPILEKLLKDKNRNGKPTVLIVAPTRDLVTQIFDNFIAYSKKTGIKGVCIFGGNSYTRQIREIQNGIDIVFASTGRLMDLAFTKKILDLENITTLVLDEADLMLDMGFAPDIERITRSLKNRKQTLLFSATMPKEVIKLVDKTFNSEYKTIKVVAKFNINDMVKQEVHMVSKNNKAKLLLKLLNDHTNEQCIIFVRTRSEAKVLDAFLKANGIVADALHSDRTQDARARILKKFKADQIQILVATNVLARGIDVSHLPLVINYNLPEEKETYVHRIGRTGRVGRSGKAISLCARSEMKSLREIEKIIKMKIEVINSPEWNDTREQDLLSQFQPKRRERDYDSRDSRGRGGSRGRSSSRFGSGFGNRDGERSYSPRNSDWTPSSRSFGSRDGERSSGSRSYGNRDGERSFGSRNFRSRDGEKSSSKYGSGFGNRDKPSKDFRIRDKPSRTGNYSGGGYRGRKNDSE